MSSKPVQAGSAYKTLLSRKVPAPSENAAENPAVAEFHEVDALQAMLSLLGSAIVIIIWVVYHNLIFKHLTRSLEKPDLFVFL